MRNIYEQEDHGNMMTNQPSSTQRKQYKYMFEYSDRAQKENRLGNNNSGNGRADNQGSTKFHKSTTSTHLGTHPKTSVENLYTHRLQSQILELQKTLDQQQYEMQTLSQEAKFYMSTCENQKETLVGLNIEALRNQYQDHIKELLGEREKVQDIISQLRQDYEEAYEEQQQELDKMRLGNDQYSLKIEAALSRKKALLTLMANKNEQCKQLEIDVREADERLDELRNIERKLTIAMREIQRMKSKAKIL